MRVDGEYSSIQFLIFLILKGLSPPPPFTSPASEWGRVDLDYPPPHTIFSSSFLPAISMLEKKMMLASCQGLSASFFSLYPKGIPSVVFGKQRKMNPFSQPLSTSPWTNQRRIHAS
jgi:hypothetical protein